MNSYDIVLLQTNLVTRPFCKYRKSTNPLSNVKVQRSKYEKRLLQECVYHAQRYNVQSKIMGVLRTVAKMVLILLQRKIEKVTRGIQGEKSSKDPASSRNLV